MKYDLFISHASEDKEVFVRPLAYELHKLSIKVWYDEFSLSPGDSLSKSIDMGLIDSAFGVIVISKEFMKKSWPDYELRSLISKEIAYGKVIIPIWHNITKDDLLNFSPFLVDKFAIDSKSKGITEVALDICKVVRSDIYNNLTRAVLYESLYNNAKDEMKMDLKELINNFPLRHEQLPKTLINRIKIIHKLFENYYQSSIEESINNFKHDTNPEREITIWEAIVSTYLDLLKCIPNSKNYLSQYNAYGLIILISITEDKEEVYKRFNKFNKEIIDIAFELYRNNIPFENTRLVAIKY